MWRLELNLKPMPTKELVNVCDPCQLSMYVVSPCQPGAEKSLRHLLLEHALDLRCPQVGGGSSVYPDCQQPEGENDIIMS